MTYTSRSLCRFLNSLYFISAESSCDQVTCWHSEGKSLCQRIDLFTICKSKKNVGENISCPCGD